ncbi:MAG: type II toxin-antitoxin system prevent-host-death family antitoxin [Caldilineaceae bacterium]|nr:type II toxin-antitoxin system prevent-host-death family antitoxin [Caldilineaceae bacterium]
MLTVTATELKNKLGEVIDLARSEPVLVQSHGRDVVVIVDHAEFARLRQSTAAIQKSDSRRQTALAAIRAGKYARPRPPGAPLPSEVFAARKQVEKALEEGSQR